MFYTTRYFYRYGKESDFVDCTFKEFVKLYDAIAYCKKYAKGLRFCGVIVEDLNGNVVFEITSDFEEVTK